MLPGRKVAITERKSQGHSILAWLAENLLPDSACRSAAEIDAAIRDERQAWDELGDSSSTTVPIRSSCRD